MIQEYVRPNTKNKHYKSDYNCKFIKGSTLSQLLNYITTVRFMEQGYVYPSFKIEDRIRYGKGKILLLPDHIRRLLDCEITSLKANEGYTFMDYAVTLKKEKGLEINPTP